MSADARDALRVSHMRLQQRCHDAEAHVERLLKVNREQADRIAWLEGEVAGWRIKLAECEESRSANHEQRGSGASVGH